MQNNKSVFRKTLNILTRILPSLFWLLLIFGFDAPYIANLTVISALIHEGGHILAASTLCTDHTVRASFIGFGLLPKGTLSYKNEFLIILAGPLANIMIFTICLLFSDYCGGYIEAFGIINLLTAISNLLPIQGYDGYRLAECTVSRLGNHPTASRALSVLSFALMTLLCFISLYLMSKLNAGYWIYFMFLFLLLKNMAKDQKCFFTRKQEKKRVFKSYREVSAKNL